MEKSLPCAVLAALAPMASALHASLGDGGPVTPPRETGPIRPLPIGTRN